MFSFIQNFFKTDYFGLIVSIKEEQKLSCNVSNSVESFKIIKKYVSSLFDREDYIVIIYPNNDLKGHVTIKIFKEKEKYILEYFKSFPMLKLSIDKENLFDLLNKKTFIEMLENPINFGFISQKGLVFCCEYGKYQPLDNNSIDELLHCIQKLDVKDEEIEIYDNETGSRFIIIREKDDKYIFEMFKGSIYNLELSIGELIGLLENGIDIFYIMQQSPNKFEFKTESI